MYQKMVNDNNSRLPAPAKHGVGMKVEGEGGAEECSSQLKKGRKGLKKGETKYR